MAARVVCWRERPRSAGGAARRDPARAVRRDRLLPPPPLVAELFPRGTFPVLLPVSEARLFFPLSLPTLRPCLGFLAVICVDGRREERGRKRREKAGKLPLGRGGGKALVGCVCH